MDPCGGKSLVHKRQLKPMNTNTFKLYPDMNNDFNDVTSDVSMFGVADYNPSINDTNRYVFSPHYHHLLSKQLQ